MLVKDTSNRYVLEFYVYRSFWSFMYIGSAGPQPGRTDGQADSGGQRTDGRDRRTDGASKGGQDEGQTEIVRF